MNRKTIILALAFISSLYLGAVVARSPLQFSGRSLLNKDQRAALLKLVQGPTPNVELVKEKKSQVKIVEPHDSHTVQSRIPATNDIDDDQLDSEGCMKKVVMVEEVEFDTEMKCQHVSQESCFESYTTTFKKTKTEECDESFKKECEIEYHKVPKEEKVEICNEMLTRNCDVDGPEVCSKEYETVCETIYEEHTVQEKVPECSTTLQNVCMDDPVTGEKWCDDVPKRSCTLKDQTSVKLTPKTECRKEVAQVCGPETCPIVKGDRICKDEIKTVIHEVPQESCHMVPRKVCNIVSKVVPTLEPVKHCIDIPKEMCAKSRINPVRKTRPVIRKWCLTGNDDFDPKDKVYLLTRQLNGHMRSQIVDSTTGDTLCSKSFTINAESIDFSSPNSLSFALVGTERKLASCGHEGEKPCLFIDVDSGDLSFDGIIPTNSPGKYAASFVDTEIDQVWHTVGGLVGDPLNADVKLRTSSLEDPPNMIFLQEDLDELSAISDKLTGRGCLLKFASYNDEEVFVYAANLNTDSVIVFVKHGDNVVFSQVEDVTMGDQPICGYSIRTEDGPAGTSSTVGDTTVYFFTKDKDNDVIPQKVHLSPLNLAFMVNMFAEGTFAILDDQSAKRLFFDIDDPYFSDPQSRARMATTVWMGDNRSVILASHLEGIYEFDANDDEFRPVPQDPVTNRMGVLMAMRATQADGKNLGCF